MLHPLESAFEMIEYINDLPSASVGDVLDTALEIWDKYGKDLRQEEYGVFQIFDRVGVSFWNSDHAKELEISVNDHLRENEHPIRVAVSRIEISHLLGRVPTMTYEVVVLDNSISEAEDPIWQKIVEEETVLENR